MLGSQSMSNLISGLIGALIATILSMIYLHISEIIRRRYDLAIDIAIYSDEIYNDTQVIHSYKTMLFDENEIPKDALEPYAASINRLRVSVTSSDIHIRAKIIYGKDSDELKALEGLRSYYTTCASILWSSTKENWTEKSEELHKLFENNIDPLRGLLEQRLVSSVDSLYIIRKLLPLKNNPNKEINSDQKPIV